MKIPILADRKISYREKSMRIQKMKTVYSGVQQGTTILTKKPFVFVLKSYHRYDHCDHCFKKE